MRMQRAGNRKMFAVERAVAPLLVGGLVVLCGLTGLGLHEFAVFEATARSAEQTRGTLQTIQAVFAALVDSETGQRGYLLTSLDSYLEPYRHGTATVHRRLVELAQEVKGSPDQQTRLARLSELTQRKLLELQRTIELHAREPQAALALVTSNEGQQLMDSIRAVSADMTAREQRQLALRADAARGARDAAVRWGGATLVALIALLVGGYVFIRRDLRRHAALAADLHDNQHLLQRAERRLRAITDAVPAMIAYIDSSETYRFTNARYRAIFDVAPETFLGRTMEQALGTATRRALKENIEAALSGEHRQFEKIGMGNAHDAIFMVDYLPDMDDRGTISGFYVMAQDITARKRAEEQVTRSERRLRDLADSLPAIISQFDADHRCTFANAQFRHFYGVEPTSVLGATQREFRGEAVYAQIKDHLDAVLQGQARQFEVFASIQGREYWLDQSLIPAVDAQGLGQGYYSISIDITERKRQEEALRKSQIFLDRTGKLAGVGGWEVDLVKREIFWSDETCRIHGVAAGYRPTLEQAIGFYAPEARPVIQAAVHAGMEHGDGWDLELQMIHADGHRIWVRAVGSVEFADGKPVRLIGAFQDVSERVCQQQALTEASARAGLATESGGIGIWDRNLDTQALAWDPRMHDLFGDPQGAADPVELWRHRVHPDDLEATERAMETAAVGGTPFDTEFRVVWPDGSVHHVRGAARVTRDASGRALRLTGANWDTTELRRLAADLAESEARTQTVALSDRDLASYVDRAYTYRLVNQTYLDYWLLERTAIVGRTVAQLLGQAAFQGFAKPNLDRAFAGEEIRYEAAFQFPGRGLRHVEIAYVPARGANGQVEGVVVRVHDIDELKQVELQLRSTVALLEKKNLSQERLVYTLSHDLREPVNTLVNFSNLLADEESAGLAPEARRYVDFIRSGSQRLRSLLDDLLDFVRVDNGSIARDMCDLRAILNDVVADLHSAIERSGGRISCDVSAVVVGQATLIRLLVQNLLANAIKFARVGVPPLVTVRADYTNGMCELQVMDEGIGVPELHREAVFELFKRLNSRKAYEGTGLGLALCRRIAEMHGGRIWISDGDHGGTCVRVTLPLAHDNALRNGR